MNRFPVSKRPWTREDVRRNEVFIQMIHEKFRKQLFGDNVSNSVTNEKLDRVKTLLAAHGLWKSKASKKKGKDVEPAVNHQDGPLYPPEPAEPIYFKIPPLKGANIDEHFYNIAQNYCKPYRCLADQLTSLRSLPSMPETWSFSPGWTRYRRDEKTGQMIVESVSHPEEDSLFFDVEVCLNDCSGKLPTMATCASPHAWYSWCSSRLIQGDNTVNSFFDQQFAQQPKLSLQDMIPMGHFTHRERLIIGHNVSFDRSFIREQHSSNCDLTRFLDTMSLHISISGLTGYQRALSFSHKVGKKNGLHDLELKDKFEAAGHPDPSNWIEAGSLNNLQDVYAFHCKKTMSKEERDIFVKGTLTDVRHNFQELLTYCAKDVDVTYQVFQELWKQYFKRFPHPVTLAGTLEMSVMYLPVNIPNWERYLEEAQNTYDDLEREIYQSLRSLANQTCEYLLDEAYKKDPWLWDLDWSTDSLKFKPKMKKKKPKKTKKEDDVIEDEEKPNSREKYPLESGESYSPAYIKDLLENASRLNKVQALLPGYPAWYRELCDRPFGGSKLVSDEKLESWEPGPCRASTQMRTVPKLLRLLWKGYPIHFDQDNKWGYLVPYTESKFKDHDSFPFEQYMEVLSKTRRKQTEEACGQTVSFEELSQEYSEDLSNVQKSGNSVEMFGLKFIRLPHKTGIENKVGNPLGKDFVRFMGDGTLTSFLDRNEARSVINIGKTLSYWKNSNKRIYSQLVIPNDSSGINGALLPRVIVAGTITRRAVEPTWLTASNAVEDRLGSELKAMVQVPEGYRFVGADVDSQELWIASLLGDCDFAMIHGCTPIGWMTLQGNKAQKTDTHSKVAELVGISRDQAKILNYGRIYGAGKAFAARFLQRSNEDLSDQQAKSKANTIYKQTKGSKVTLTNSEGNFVRREWRGGSESHMFNMLEKIALSPEPATPVLGCKISKALLPNEVRQHFLPSVINWVVQSSAVDYLHLMLVSMKWLFDEYDIDGRFCLSIHDEVRYMVRDEDKYKAALALQVTNLLTRSMFSYKLGLRDLPLGVAFFSAVDIDTVFRKEVYLDCKTPSNPHGLKMGYGIERGESMDINQLLNKSEIQALVFDQNSPTGDGTNDDPSLHFQTRFHRQQSNQHSRFTHL
ncbi:DNA polymerase gamma, catalytic subunit tam isoform X2 [Brevipalpus obovatus]|uniref:DNA polymerase gamma, catalytic subunit tam isoform X2 n=1 Tax=Brevipalpus obovatus TaxID=246614 RepID=UPI003D9DB594